MSDEDPLLPPAAQVAFDAAYRKWTCGKCKNEFGNAVTKWNCCVEHARLAPLCPPCAFGLHPDDINIQSSMIPRPDALVKGEMFSVDESGVHPEPQVAKIVPWRSEDALLATRITRQFVCIANNCRRKDEVREIRAIELGNDFYGIPFSIICGACGAHAVQVQLDDWSG